MKPGEVVFLRRLVADRPLDRRREGVAARMCELEGLGVRRGAHVVYRDGDYTSAANLLRARGYPIKAPEGDFARSEAGPGGSEKTGSLSVTHGMVAVMLVAGPALGEGAFPPKGSFVAMPWEVAMALPYEVLLVSENLEPLVRLHEYRWLADFIKGRQALAMFRGGPGMFRTDAAAKLIAADARPTLAFFDFDPKGLSMAASLPRREALCLPPWPELNQKTRTMRRDHLFTQSEPVSRPHLDRLQDPEIAQAWRRLKLLATGLDQESFPR